MPKKSQHVLLIALYSGENLAVRLFQPLIKQRGHQCNILFFDSMNKQSLKHSLTNHPLVARHNSEPPPEENYTKLIEFINLMKPDIIGINLLSMYYDVAVKITKTIKENSRATVVWGGPHCTVATQECIDHADYVCYGEGVKSFPDLIDALATGKAPEAIQGFAYKKDGKMVINAPQEPVEDLDALPFIDFSGINKYYLKDGHLRENFMSPHLYGCIDTPYQTIHRLMTAWGCPFKCKYCINSMLKSKIRRRSVDNVIAELKQVKSNNPYLRVIVFYDDVFTVDKTWCEEFAEKYKREIDLPFFCYSHSKFANPEILEIVRKAGCIVITIGIQSGSEKSRRLMGRYETNDDIVKAAHNFVKLRNIPYKGFPFQIYYDFIHDNPIESREDLDKTLRLLCEIPKNFVINLYSLNHFPNYPLTNYLLENNLIDPGDVLGNADTHEEVSSYYKSPVPHAKDEEGKRSDFYRIAFSMAQYRLFPRFFLKGLITEGLWRNYWYNNQKQLFTVARGARYISLTANFRIFLSMLRLMPFALIQKRPALLTIDAKPVSRKH